MRGSTRSAGRGLIVLVAMGMAVQTMASPAATAAARLRGDWSQYKYDPAHTGSNPEERTLGRSNVGQLVVDWSGPFDFNPICCSSPSVVDRVVYVGTGDNHLRAYRAGSGEQLWQADVGGGQVSTPAVSRGLVFVGSGDWTVSAFQAVDGGLRWRYRTGGPVVGAPTIVGRTLYVASTDGIVYAFEARTGDIQWTSDLGADIDTSPTVSEGAIYVATYSPTPNLYALSTSDGSPLWSSPLDSAVDFASPAVSNGVVYATSLGGEVYAFDAGTGSRLWTTTPGGLIEASPTVADGLVYVGTYDGVLYALDPATGGVEWSAPTGNLIAGSASAANGVVYVGSTDNTVRAFHSLTGQELWSFSMGGPVQFSGPTVSRGRLFVAADRLFAFELP